MAYLLDTNAWIRFLKSPTSRIRARLASIDSRSIFTCSIVKAELFYGARKYGNPERRLQILERLFEALRSFHFDDRAAAAYGSIRHELESRGTVIAIHTI